MCSNLARITRKMFLSL